MILYRGTADDQLLSNLAVVHARHHERKYVALALGQIVPERLRVCVRGALDQRARRLRCQRRAPGTRRADRADQLIR